MSVATVSPPPLPSKQFALSALLALLALELLAATGLGVPHLQTLLATAWSAADALRWFAPVAAAWLLLHACGHAHRGELLAGAGAAAAIALLAVAGVGPAWSAQQPVLTALGATALLAFAHLLLLSRQDASTRVDDPLSRRGVAARELLWLCLLLAFFDLLLQQLGNFTIVLHPLTHDAELYRLDAAFGLAPNAPFAGLAQAIPGAAALFGAWHALLAAAVCAWVGWQLRRGARGEALRVLEFVLLAGVVFCIAANFYPATGPAATFPKLFPGALPAPANVEMASNIVVGSARVAMPALYFGIACGLFVLAWRHGRIARALFGALLALSFFAELASGAHWLLDLVVAMPLTLALLAILDRSQPWSGIRRDALLLGAALFGAWLCVLSNALVFLVEHVLLSWLIVLLTVALCATAGLRLQRAGAPLPPRAARSGTSEPWLLYGMFFISGAAALIYQVLFSKQLTYVFGSMSTATNTVLATYMGGMALGAWLGGLLAPRLRRPVVAYAICELLIAIYCAASPLVFKLVRGIYVGLASGHVPDAPGLLPMRVLLGGAGLIVPTILMGLTLPILARFFEQRQVALGFSAGRLYAANTLGASVGALLAGYMLLPLIGVRNTTLIAVVANLLVAALGMRFQKTRVETLSAEVSVAAQEAPATGTRAQGWIAIAILTGGGFVTLALEVNFIHLLAVTAGNSTYAFSLMLCAFLLGLGGGAEAGRWMMRRMQLLRLLAWLEFGLCAAILLSVSRMDEVPAYFASYAQYPLPLGWGAREVIRGLVCCMAMIPPALFIGAIFPVAIECVGRGFPARPIRMLGFASALNTLGNILGVLLAGFLLLPLIGPLPSIRLLAGICLVLGLLAALGVRERRLNVLVPAGVAALWLLLLPPTLDYDRLITGANVYFRAQNWGHVIDRAESLDGGLTTISVGRMPSGEEVRTLLTNGKFQGNDAASGEMVAQVGFAMAPLLQNARREAALVIGYGTGNTSRVLHDAGFAQLDIVDLSADVFRLANRHLASINQHVTDQPGVNAYVTDGRNFLLLSRRSYDVISMEISSIWFAGAASLYNRDFYRLVSTHLSEGGVLQQWMQIHHMAPTDLLYILGSMRAEFRYVWLYMIGDQGIVVATNSAQAMPSEANIAAIDTHTQMKSEIEHYGGTAARLIDNLLLDPDGVDRLLASQGVPREYFVSDDDNAHLEYSTPKGNALNTEQSMDLNMQMLARFAQPATAPAK